MALVGGEFDLEMNFIIQDAESITCMSELLEHCDVTCQAEIWSMFTAILRKSVRNLQTSTEVGLIEQVLLKMSTVDDMIADLLVDMLGVLASYSITVKELKLLFSMLRGENGIWPRHAVKLLSVLNQMPQRHGPDTFFNFPGCSAAAIALPPIAKWPYQNGFTLNTWFRMDPLNNINVDKDKPYLYCFRTSKGVGYSAHFVGNCLIVTSLKSKGKGFQHCVKYDFQPRKWYMISIVHIYNRWRNSEIRCYVNGQLVSYGDMAWHVNTNDSYDKCFLGSSETADANRVFCGQLGAVYVFTEALNPAQIFAIHQLGPGYKSTFKFKSESDIHLAEHHKQVLYDGKLASSIAFTYNAKATDAQLCLESSPKENPSIFVHSPHALMLQDVKAIVTHSIHSAIHSIGGIQVLFPLFAQLDNRQLHDSQVETTVCATLLAFLVELLKSSVAMQEQMLGGKGFLVIGYLLEKSSRVHITRAVLEQFLSFAKYLDGLSHGAPLLKQLCDHILFNPAIWIHTPAKVQLSLYTYLSAEFIGTATIYNTIRRVGTVLQLMHTLKYYYWVVNPADSSGITPKGLDGPRPSQKEIISLRAFMLLFLKQLILKDRGVKEDELQSILNYLLTMHEDENIHDVLQLLVALMSEHPASMIPAFDQRNGIRVIYKLLASKSESIWVQALKVLGYFLKHLGHKRKVEIMHTHSLFTLLGERLMLHTNTVTVTTYNTLYEILTEQVCTQVVHKPHPEPDSTVKIQNPMILKVVATLLKNSTPSAELMEVRRLFLSDMIKLFSNSRENRRCLLQCSVWQDWMFSLGYINPKNSEEQKITEMVYNIFRILLYHAIKYEWGGWRVWVDTLSIAHSKVTYEAHKEYLAKMYEEYQRQEEENIKKGKKGNVSTISGLSSQTTGAKGGMEIREIEDLSQSQSPESETDYPVSTDTRDLLMATKVSDDVLGSAERPGGGVHVEVHDLLVDIKAEKVEATEVKLDDMDLSPETLVTGENGALVEVESLLDNVYSAAVEKLQNNVHGSVGIIKKNEEKDNGPLITLADEKDEPSTNSTSFLFDKIPSQEEKLLPELSSNHISIPNVQETQMHLGVNDDLGLLAHMTGSVDITCASSIIEDKEFKIHTTSDGMSSISERELASSSKGLEYAEMTATTLETESSGSKTVPSVDAGSIISDTERSDDGKEAGKEIRKIQTTTTTQAVQGRSVTQQDRDLRVDLGFRGMPMTEEQRRQFSPGPRTTMFRIPEFKWSPMHQRLLTDLLFALETDVHVWRSHSTKSVMDFVNSNENIIFVHNTIHLISQMVDNIIIACGGILPLLSAATSPTGSKTELENIEVTQGMSAETAVTFLSRLMAMVDVLVFASSLNFSEIEAEKNMSSGGLMRQCLRLVCCVAVRNCLECRQRQRERVNKTSLLGSKTQDALQGVTASAATKTPLENVPGNLSPIKDPDRLLQDVDINRLRAVVFRDVDDSKQAQFLALAVVYFISVLMVSKYRDILEPQRETARSGSQAGRNIRQEINSPTSTVVVIPSIPHPSLNHGFLAKLIPEQSFTHSFYKETPTVFPENIKDKETPTPVEDIQLESSIPHTDSGIGDEQMPNILNGTDLETSTGPDAMSELLSTLSSEVKKSQESLTESPSEILKPASSISSISQSKGINVKEILKSLVAAPVEIAECGPDPIPYPDPALKREAHAILPMQFHSFDRSVVVPVKKPPPGSLAVTTVGAATAGSGLPPGSTPNIFAATGATPKSMINTTGAVDSGSSSSSSSSSFVNGATSKNLPAVQTVAPMPEDSAENMSITAKLERALEKVAPLLREIFVDFAPFLSRTLLGSHGQELLIEGLVCMKSSTSVVELVMLLCSQEWQNSIQKNAGLAFIELINEGRLLCHAMKDHIVRVANEAEFILNRQRAEDVHKHAEFESQCAQYAADRREEEKMCDHLISAAKHRDHVTANQLKQKILNILTNKHGAWGAVSHSQLHDFWRLDYWEDDLRRRRRFVRNAFGSTHSDALLKAAVEYGTEEDVVKSKKTFRSQAVVNQNAETELMLEGDDDAVSLLQEKEIDNLAADKRSRRASSPQTPSCSLKRSGHRLAFPPGAGGEAPSVLPAALHPSQWSSRQHPRRVPLPAGAPGQHSSRCGQSPLPSSSPGGTTAALGTRIYIPRQKAQLAAAGEGPGQGWKPELVIFSRMRMSPSRGSWLSHATPGKRGNWIKLMVFLLGLGKAHKRLLKMIEYRVVSRTHLRKALFSPHKGPGEPITVRRAKRRVKGEGKGWNAPLERVEAFRLDLRHPVGSRPGDVGKRPVGSTPRPDPRAFERRGDLHDVPIPDPQLHFAGVRHHLYHVSVTALIHGLSHQSLKSGPDFASGEVQHDFELRGGDDFQALVAIVHLVQGADEARLLHLHLLQHVRHHFADFSDGFGDGSFPGLAFLVVVFIQMIHQLGLGRDHVGAEIRIDLAKVCRSALNPCVPPHSRAGNAGVLMGIHQPGSYGPGSLLREQRRIAIAKEEKYRKERFTTFIQRINATNFIARSGEFLTLRLVLAYTEGLHGKWMFSEIRAVFSRRYLLQNTALEVFMANRTSVMFNFPDQATVKKVVYSLPRVGVGTSYGLPQARRISLATPRQLYKSSNMTQRWQRREISNFEYLMFLNTIAGRTYNDLNQYPVFPWVLTNYESEELDLTLPGNFRDLSKPIGALNPKRAVFYAERYETWEDDQTPPYHYNTHYSTSTSTLAWLVRIEPFTTFFLNANDGKFDHPDRTFSSVARSWRNSQRDTSDVKELIPEFYYLPEMFVNSNGYNLGIREDEVVVNDVDLPPWAKKPEDFVRINRMALESEFVSCQLHQWIDLIFGYKQRGPEAVRALNVFHYLTYEGSVNLDSITDPVLREAMEAQIQNFGQTPSQLLIEPHPPRSSAMHLSPLMFKDQMQQDVIMVLKFPSNSPVTHVAANTLPHLTIPAVVTVTCSRLFAVNRWHNTVGLRGAPGYSLDQAHHLPIEMDPLIANNSGVNKRQITDLVDQSIQINAHCFVVTADNRYILICGFWDKSFRVYSTETGKLTQIVFGHWDVVTCLARSESYIGGDCYIVSGSRDATLLLWYWSGRHHIIGDNPNSSDYPAPRAVLTGHDHEVVCVSVCAELGLVISGAKDCTSRQRCIDLPSCLSSLVGKLSLWSWLWHCHNTRSTQEPAEAGRQHIQDSSEKNPVHQVDVCMFLSNNPKKERNFSINGKLLAQMEINDSTRAILLSSDGQNLVTGGDNGVVEVWQACDFKQLYIYPGCDAGIRAMDLSHDQRTLITGMASGSIVAFNIDFNRWHYEHQNRY
ncbi:PREDICTED: neurobeachin [Charadrius vociferus]|nr:PREDICTED: neurobeachin [Charadrius vociferus]